MLVRILGHGKKFDTYKCLIHVLLIRYQVYESLIPSLTYEKNGYCPMAVYTAIDDKHVKVTNSQRIGSTTGEVDTVTGTLSLPDPKHPGKWEQTMDKEYKSHKPRGFYW